MKVYNCHWLTGELLCSNEAKLDPIDQNPMIPVGSTTVEPPAPQTGFARCFVNGQWQQIEDHRGETWYSGHTPVQIVQLGPVPDWLTAEEAPLSDEEKLVDLRSKRDAKLADCDWTQLADSPLTSDGKSAWAVYRQALRDLPATSVDLDHIEWPDEPVILSD